MSTKSTLAHDDTFHFYQELMEDDHVFLELHTTQFEAGYGRVMIPIPLHVWETIRHLGAADLSLVDKTDDELLRRVEPAVDQRIAAYRESEASSGGAGLRRFAGMLVYGTADLPRDQQIDNGMLYFMEERQRQRQLREAIEATKARASRRDPQSSGISSAAPPASPAARASE